MRHSSLRALLLLTLGLTTLGAGAVRPARAADCGGGVPCHCGDRVVTNTRLGGSDPVLRTPCPCDGLIVASGVSLEIRGTITGESDLCSGILLEGNATGVAVTNGRITGFGLGIDGDSLGPVSGNRFANLQIFAGFLLTGDANVVESNVVRDALVAGVMLIGDGNTVRLNRAEGAALSGLSVIGDANAISRNVARRNSGDGIDVAGENVTVDLNRAEYNDNAGFVLEGSGLTVSRNIAASNALDGFAVGASASTFDRNRSDHNLLFGIEEFGPPNIYLNNRCTGNELGASNPPGLCR
jgi:hypothetical protein